MQGTQPRKINHFYPRPPRGGRRTQIQLRLADRDISIHALREEGDSRAFSTSRRSLTFLSTPSARRATSGVVVLNRSFQFLSTPSARRATLDNFFNVRRVGISIHALREEGDPITSMMVRPRSYFYPRPPRGGRPKKVLNTETGELISIHALREEGDLHLFWCSSSAGLFLSTPSARRATGLSSATAKTTATFLSTPSARRATFNCSCCWCKLYRFLSTPSARRATLPILTAEPVLYISIHALREEGDRIASAVIVCAPISIHALREEGDCNRHNRSARSRYFYPRPPRGGRRQRMHPGMLSNGFLSTPSARRATIAARTVMGFVIEKISIHALREEGDQCTASAENERQHFYPRPPRGGRRQRHSQIKTHFYFYPRPPRGGRLSAVLGLGFVLTDFYPRPPRGGRPERTWVCKCDCGISIHALREEGDQG